MVHESLRDLHDNSNSSTETFIPSQGYIDSIRDLKRKKRAHLDYSAWETSLGIENTKDQTSTRFGTVEDSYPIEPFSLNDDKDSFNQNGFLQFSSKKKKKDPTNSDEDQDSTDDVWFQCLKESYGPSGCPDAASVASNYQPCLTEGAIAEQALEKKPTESLLESLMTYLITDQETPAQALQRLGHVSDSNQKRISTTKKIPRKKMDPDTKKNFDALTEHCHVLMLTRGYHDIFSVSRETIRQEAEKHRAQQKLMYRALGESQLGENHETDESFWRLEFHELEDADRFSKHTSRPYSLKEVHQLIQEGYISIHRPARVLEVSSENVPLNGVWYSWETLQACDSSHAKSIQQNASHESSSSVTSSSEDSEDDYDIEC